ncbi:hypothetical protein [Priestia aryabhattai]
MEPQEIILRQLCEVSAELAANTVYGGYTPQTIEYLKGQAEAYSIATLIAYGKVTNAEEVKTVENMEFLAKLVRKMISRGYTTGNKKLDDALSFSYQLT